MKKFFSLVLALVMALSLTTVAWGADALQSAIAAGETDIVLPAGNYNLPTTTGDVTISGTTDAVITIGTPKAESITLKGVTVVGSGLYTGIQHSTKVVYKDCVIKGMQCLYATDVEFINCDFDSNGKEHCVWTYGAKNVTFTNCDFTYSDRAVNVYTETNGLSATVVFDECDFTKVDGKTSAGAIEINSSGKMGTADVSVEDTTVNQGELWWVSGWDSDYGRDASVKEDGVEYAAAEVDGVKYTTLGAAIQAANDGDTITLLDDIKLVDGQGSNPSALTVDKDVTIDLAGHDIASAAGSNAGIKATADVTIEDSEGGSSVSIPLAEDTNGDITITGGSYTDDVSDYLAAGLEQTTTGVIVSSSTHTEFDTKDAKTMAVKGTKALTLIPAKGAYVATATGNWVGGWVKHYVDEYGTTYVPCTADVEGALIVYYKGTTSVYDTVVAANPFYDAVAAEFTSFGTACGQLDNRADTTAKYYTYADGNGIVYLNKGTTATAKQVMVNGKLVGVEAANLIGNLNAHKWVVEKNAKNEITKATCSLCGQQASWTLNLASVPTGATFVPAPGGGFLYWNAAPVVDTETKVESAETFDAGIAMYVGMSVMAAAGSAVVLKKRED